MYALIYVRIPIKKDNLIVHEQKGRKALSFSQEVENQFQLQLGVPTSEILLEPQPGYFAFFHYFANSYISNREAVHIHYIITIFKSSNR